MRGTAILLFCLSLCGAGATAGDEPAPSADAPTAECPSGGCPDPGLGPGLGPVPDPGTTITVFQQAPSYAYPSVAKLVPGSFGLWDHGDDWQARNGCTGTLIHPRVVLTAGHCVIDNLGRLEARISVRFRKTRQAAVHTQTVRLTNANTALADDYYPRDDGNLKWSIHDDLAMLLLPEPVPDSDTRVARLASNEDVKSHSVLILAGYGNQYYDYSTGTAAGPRRLGFVTSRAFPMRIGGGRLQSSSFQISAEVEIGGRKVAVGVCNGDSGGPFFIAPPGAALQARLAGVIHGVRYGDSIGNCTLPDNRSYIIGLLAHRAFLRSGYERFGLLP